LIFEIPRRNSVAASLGEEDRDRVVGRVLLEHVIAGNCVRGVSSTPFVRIERIEIEPFGGLGTASQVVLKHGAEFGDVGGGVTNGDLAVFFGVAVGFDVASSGEDVRGSIRTVRWKELVMKIRFN
jgi:hypothetical protein